MEGNGDEEYTSIVPVVIFSSAIVGNINKNIENNKTPNVQVRIVELKSKNYFCKILNFFLKKVGLT